MEQEIKALLENQDKKIDAIYSSVEKSRKYFLITMWITAIALIVPMCGLLIFGSSALSTYSQTLETTDQ